MTSSNTVNQNNHIKICRKNKIISCKTTVTNRRTQMVACRALLGEDDVEVTEVEQHQTISQKQRDESYTRLKKLLEDGFEMVTNIRVAGDAREISRRIEEEETRRQRSVVHVCALVFAEL